MSKMQSIFSCSLNQKMIDLEPAQLEEVQSILGRHFPKTKVLAFGSRVSGKAKKYSDLDLVIQGSEPISTSQMQSLKDAFSSSSLSILVDVLDWHQIPDSFKKTITESQNEVIHS